MYTHNREARQHDQHMIKDYAEARAKAAAAAATQAVKGEIGINELQVAEHVSLLERLKAAIEELEGINARLETVRWRLFPGDRVKPETATTEQPTVSGCARRINRLAERANNQLLEIESFL